jgi:lysozyme
MNGPIAEATELAAGICRPFEGLRLKPYICPAGYPTQGYGTVFKPDGTRVKITDPPITKETAEAWLVHELWHNYIANILKASPHLVAHPRVLGAMGSFAYNLGVARYRASTLRRRIKEENWVDAKKELMRWTRVNGKVLRGLVRRRKAECALF